MTGLQTVLLFVTGYGVSRLVLRADAHLVFVDWLVRRSHGRASRVVLGVMLASFGLSTIIPNALTVLAMIPVITRLKAWAGEDAMGQGFGTLLAIGLIYGANLGGVGSLLGSPANLYLMVNLRIFDVAGRESLHFVSWLIFGVPMALALVGLSWGMLHLTERNVMSIALPDTTGEPTPRGPLFGAAGRWTLTWGLGWAVLIVVGLIGGAARGSSGHPAMVLPGKLAVTWLDLAAAAWSVLYVAGLFLRRVKTPGGPERLLRVADLWREVPVKGVLLGLGVLVLLVVVAYSGAVGGLKRVLPYLTPGGVGPFVMALVLVLVTIFATEVLNNTTVSTVMFPLTAALAGQVGADPLLLMLGVSLASTCAFMTPVATPVNALAFGGVGGVSLGKFVKNGLLMNLLSAGWIALWLTWLIPRVLALFR